MSFGKDTDAYWDFRDAVSRTRARLETIKQRIIYEASKEIETKILTKSESTKLTDDEIDDLLLKATQARLSEGRFIE